MVLRCEALVRRRPHPSCDRGVNLVISVASLHAITNFFGHYCCTTYKCQPGAVSSQSGTESEKFFRRRTWFDTWQRGHVLEPLRRRQCHMRLEWLSKCYSVPPQARKDGANRVCNGKNSRYQNIKAQTVVAQRLCLLFIRSRQKDRLCRNEERIRSARVWKARGHRSKKKLPRYSPLRRTHGTLDCLQGVNCALISGTFLL